MVRDILAGGILVTRDGCGPIAPKTPFSRRRRVLRSRKPARVVLNSAVQPGQLASPHLRFGFPSLSLH